MGWILPQPPVKLAAKVDGPLIPQLCLQNWDLPFLDHVDQAIFLEDGTRWVAQLLHPVIIEPSPAQKFRGGLFLAINNNLLQSQR